MSSGQEEDFSWMEKRLQEKYQIKTKWLGPKEAHEQEIKILNRKVSWTEAGITYEADPRHAKLMIQKLQFVDGKGVVTPGTHDEGRTSNDQDVKLEAIQEIAYRAIVARANYLSPDRFDISFAVTELAGPMSAPVRGD